MGRDGYGGTAYARDAFGYVLNYYEGDYEPISRNSSNKPFAEMTGVPGFRGLYNGNIASMSVYLPKLGTPVLYNYRYDQLNRLTAMQPLTGLDTASNQWNAIPINNYKENLGYDVNGNILKYVRYGHNGNIMDNLTYLYNSKSNQLNQITDKIAANKFQGDIDNQNPNNYLYDKTGNLTKDVKEGIDSIYWNVYGKIASIKKQDTIISYSYDASGNRISKTVTKPGSSITTWYVRDASGNVMSVYTRGDNSQSSGQLTQSETHLYGSSRIGLFKPDLNVEMPSITRKINLPGVEPGYFLSFERGRKVYELSNHLGNVLATVSDRRLALDLDQNGIVDYYLADVLTAQDYYPFGMMMQGRSFSSSGNRYGFNGQEQDNEIKGEGNSYGAEFWEYDSRSGRRWNVDPKPNPSISNYATFANNPIFNIDVLGDTTYRFNKSDGSYVGMFDLDAAGQIGSYRSLKTLGKGKNKQEVWEGQRFEFADPANDPQDIRSGTMNKLVFVSNDEIKDLLTQGAFNYDDKNNSWRFYKNSKGGQNFVYSYSVIPDKYGAQGASKYPLTIPSRVLFLPEGDYTAHNHMNFGNYLWGASGYTLGFNFATLQVGAHINSLKNSKENGYPAQWDSKDDQNSIKKGAFHALQFKYRTILELRHQAEVQRQGSGNR